MWAADEHAVIVKTTIDQFYTDQAVAATSAKRQRRHISSLAYEGQLFWTDCGMTIVGINQSINHSVQIFASTLIVLPRK
jgi:hypothetical protein